MNIKNAMKLSLSGDTFDSMKKDFDSILSRTIANMDRKNADEAVITLKLSISLEKDVSEWPTGGDASEITKPKFAHTINSVMQVKDKKTGALSGEHELVWDEELGEYVLVSIGDEQLSAFDSLDDSEKEGLRYLKEEEYAEKEKMQLEAPKESQNELGNEYMEDESLYDDIDDVSTPFGWLHQFVGKKLSVTNAAGTKIYTVKSDADRKTILSSGANALSPFYIEPETLACVMGKELVCKEMGVPFVREIVIEVEGEEYPIFTLQRQKKAKPDDERFIEYDTPEV